jgi:hypothetical protein
MITFYFVDFVALIAFIAVIGFVAFVAFVAFWHFCHHFYPSSLSSLLSLYRFLIIGIGLNPSDPSSWLEPVAGQPLHFNVQGYPGYTFLPYMEIQNEIFAVYPIIVS